jgi:hypothetical protein
MLASTDELLNLVYSVSQNDNGISRSQEQSGSVRLAKF